MISAIEIANSIRYGLACSMWTQNLSRAHRVAQQIEAGTVWINCWMLVCIVTSCASYCSLLCAMFSCLFLCMQRDLRVPFGGVKHSGLGRASGEHSIDFYTEQKNICIKLS
jgi:aminomuconate-semialdehyde/2-hydroxymuconate-6-semialdehyde dehydrogenase